MNAVVSDVQHCREIQVTYVDIQKNRMMLRSTAGLVLKASENKDGTSHLSQTKTDFPEIDIIGKSTDPSFP